MRRLIPLALLLAGCPVNAPVIRELPASAEATAGRPIAGVSPVSYSSTSVRVGDACCVLVEVADPGPVAAALRAEGIEPVWRGGALVVSLDHDRRALGRAAERQPVLEEARRLLRDLELGR